MGEVLLVGNSAGTASHHHPMADTGRCLSQGTIHASGTGSRDQFWSGAGLGTSFSARSGLNREIGLGRPAEPLIRFFPIRVSPDPNRVSRRGFIIEKNNKKG